MRAELLIQTHRAHVVQSVKDCNNINLSTFTSISPNQNICVHLHMQHCVTSDMLNTVRSLDFNSDILQQLDEYIHEEIEHLHDLIMETMGHHQVVCFLCGQTTHHA